MAEAVGEVARGDFDISTETIHVKQAITPEHHQAVSRPLNNQTSGIMTALQACRHMGLYVRDDNMINEAVCPPLCTHN